MIKSISVKGFKSLWDATIELGKLNVFIGTNGAGKSNLLEAIAMASASVEGGIDYERLSRRGARLSAPEVFRSAFKNQKRRSTFSIELETDTLSYKMGVNAVNDFSYNSESLTRKGSQTRLCGRSNNGATLKGEGLEHIPGREKSIIPLYRTLDNNDELSGLEQFAIYAPSTPVLRGVVSDSSSKSPLGLYGGRLAEALAETLSTKSRENDLQRFFQLLDWFKQVGSTDQVDRELISSYVTLGRNIVSFKDQFMKSNFNHLYAYDVSEGALYVLFVLVLLSHPKAPKLFALDNVDNSLNPLLVRELVAQMAQVIEHSNKQVILTTHNPSTLDSVDLFNENHRLFVVKRDRNGFTQVERIVPPAGSTREEWQTKYYGLKLSEIWLSGAIGGLIRGF